MGVIRIRKKERKKRREEWLEEDTCAVDGFLVACQLIPFVRWHTTEPSSPNY
jgi:hypothetical protein